MNEVHRSVQRKKTIRRICQRLTVGKARSHIDRDTNQCVPDAIGVVFLLIQARTFAKLSPDTRTWLVCIDPTVLKRKQPTHGEVEKVSGKRIAQADGRS
jgi:hypothetical protein